MKNLISILAIGTLFICLSAGSALCAPRKVANLSQETKSEIRVRVKFLTKSLRRASIRGNAQRVQRITQKIARLRSQLRPIDPGSVGTFSGPCTDINSTLAVEVNNFTDLEISVSTTGRPSLGEAGLPLHVGVVLPGKVSRLLVLNSSLVYGRSKLLFEPMIAGSPLESEDIAPFERKLNVVLPTRSNCVSVQNYEVIDSDFGPDSINVAQPNEGNAGGSGIGVGEVIDFVCPSSLVVQGDGEAILEGESHSGPDGSGFVLQSCNYRWNPTKTTVISGPLVEIRYAVDGRYFEEFGYPLGCYSSSSDTLFYSSSRQFFVHLSSFILDAERVSLAADLLSQYEVAGAHCP